MLLRRGMVFVPGHGRPQNPRILPNGIGLVWKVYGGQSFRCAMNHISYALIGAAYVGLTTRSCTVSIIMLYDYVLTLYFPGQNVTRFGY